MRRVGLPEPIVADPAPAAPRLDRASAHWVRALASSGTQRDDAHKRLYELLQRVSRRELARRNARVRISGAELDDLADQAAGDALLAIWRKLPQFRGDSRFTTWACKFAILEVSSTIARHLARASTISLDAEDWERLPDRFGFDPAAQTEWRELISALEHAVKTELSDRQRRVFVAIVLNGVPLDVLVAELGSNRNAIYKTLFDARQRLRRALDARGLLDPDPSEQL
jgi:RNA polymerase sigma-70 factor (ECF subfamily)